MFSKEIPHFQCTLSDTNLFDPPLVQTDIEEGQYEDVYPLGKLEDTGPIEFNVESAIKFVDLASSYLKLKLQIVNSDGSLITTDSNVTFSNNIISTLFEQVDVYLGGHLVTSSTSMYSYRAMFEVLLNYSSQSKNDQMQLGMYYKDTSGHMSETDPAKSNSGLTSRHTLTKKSAVVEVIGRIHADIFNQGRLILNSLPLRILFHRQKDAFCLMSDEDKFKVNVVDAVMCVRKATLTADKFRHVQEKLQKTPAIYPIDRVGMFCRSVPAGLTSLNWDNAIMGQIPKKVFVAMVDNNSFTGVIKKNPFVFRHNNLTTIGVYVEGQSRPMRPLKLEFSTHKTIEGYLSLLPK